MIRTWAGPLPAWQAEFEAHVAPLEKYGWKFLTLNYPDEHSLQVFKERAASTIGMRVKPELGSRKICEFDPALAMLFPSLVARYDFWGHFNLDCVYGRIDKWLPDSLLDQIDIFGNDPGAICGPFTVYRNIPMVNNLFMRCEGWQTVFQDSEFHGFDEGAFSKEVVKAATFHDIRFLSANWHSHDKMPMHVPPALQILSDGSLIEGKDQDEIFMFHFNETRRWPVS